MPIKVTIDIGAGPVDYTQYIVSGSIKVEDSINTPALVAFSVANINNAFNVPLINGYVRIFSTSLSKTLFSGFISSVPAPEFLGAGSNVPKFGFQRLVWSVNATSDEYLLNVKSVPFIPAFVNQTQGQILTAIASSLAPGFFDTTNIASGDLIPYYIYDPSKKWSDVAKELGDQSRMHHWALDKKLFFQPLGDAPLAISYDETQPQTTFYPAVLQTNVSPIQPLNDAIVIGDVEPQNSWDNYFIGDGITNGFDAKHKVFRGASSVLLKDDWTETAFQKNSWNVVDPTNTMSLPGSLNVTNGSVFALGTSYLEALNGIELGGALDLQHGEFSFNDTCAGIIGGVYSATVPTQSNCLSGFAVSPLAYQQAFNDTFLRTDVNPLSGAWVTQPGTTNCQIVGNTVQGTANGSSARNAAYYNTPLGSDQYSEVTILAAGSASAFPGCGVRMGTGTGETAYYALAQGPLGAGAKVYIQKIVGGVSSNLNSATTTINAGDVLRIEVKGTLLTLKVNGATIITATDGTLQYGFAGVFVAPQSVAVNTCVVDNFGAGSIAPTIGFDNFTRANSPTLGGFWTVAPGNVGGFQILGNTAVPSATGVNIGNAYIGPAFPDDQFCEVKLGIIPTGGSVVAVQVRTALTVNTLYAAILQNTNVIALQRNLNGGGTTLASGTATFNVGDTLRIEVVGTLITLRRNGVALLTAQDSAVTSGNPSIYGTNNVQFTQWTAGSVGSTVVTATASGASGLQIQPVLNGQLVGTPVPVKANHHYFLRTILTSRTFSRYNKAYRTLAGAVFGNLPVSSTVDATFIIYDIDLAAFNLLPGGVVPIFVPPPVPSKQFFTNNNWPSFGVYALINQNQLNLNVSSTILSLPPQGTLQVASLYGPTGTQLPISPIATNLLQFPNDFENAVWTKGTVTIAADAVLAPDGTLVADAVTANVGSTDAVVVYQNLPVTTGQTYTLSVWLRVPAASGMNLALALKDGFSVGAFASGMCALTPVWQRFSVTRTMGVLNNPVAAIGGFGTWTQGEIDMWGARLDAGSTIASSAGGPPVPYALGFGYGEQVATINTGQDSDILQFYTDTIPAVGARIRLQTWEPGKSIARVQNPVDIATEAKIVGDDGVRTFIYTNLQPLPRTSVDCEAAASALLSDYVKTQWDGQYEAHNHFWDSGSNSVLFSQNFSNPVWANVRSSIVANTTTAPDGTLTGTKLVEDASNNSHVIFQTIPITAGAVMTISVFAKAAERPAIVLDIYGTGPLDVFSSYFDLVNGRVGAPGTNLAGKLLGASIQAVGNGWYRCSVTGTIGTNTSMVVQVDIAQNALTGGNSYAGNGASGVFIWGAQAQPGAQPPTAYILTTAVAIVHDYPKTGRFFAVNTTQRGISGQQFLVRKVTTSVLEMYDEIIDFTIEFGQDTYIEKLLTKFVSRDQNVLTPKDSAFPPNLQFIQNVGQTYAPTLEKAQATFIDSSFVQIDLGVVPLTGCEVRAVDSGWGSPKNRVGLFTTQTFQLNRTTLNQIWYLRQVNGPKISRQSKVIHVGYPLLPSPPVVVQTDVSDFQLPKIQFDFNGDIRNIYGIEIRDSDNVTVLEQIPVFSTADLLYTFDNTTRRVSQQTFFVYFFNLMWGYSTPLIFTLQCAALPSGGKNCISNPGFEINNVGTTARLGYPLNAAMTDGWFIASQNVGLAALLDNSPTFPRSGLLCLEITPSGLTNTVLAPVSTPECRVFSTPNIPVRGGQVVYFGGYCRIDRNFAPPAGVTVFGRIGLIVRDATGAQLSENILDFTSVGTGWQFNTVALTVPLNAAYVTLECAGFVSNTTGSPITLTGSGTVGDFRFDDLFLIEQENLDQVPNGTRAAWDTGTQKAAAVDSAGNILLKNVAGPTATTGNPTQTSTTYSVIPEMTTTITTLGNKILILFYMSIASNVNPGTGNNFAIFRDGVQLTANARFDGWGTSIFGTMSLAWLDQPSAGSHTYDVRWKALSGDTIQGSSTSRGLQVVELG